MNNNEEKLDLINKIKTLIDINSSDTTINTKYIEYFEIDELQEIVDRLINKKTNNQKSTSSYLDEIFTKCS